MTTRTVVGAIAALAVLGYVELTGQRRREEPPIRQIDHVMIKADDPREIFAFFTETLGLPIAWALEERGGVVSGGVGFGNVNVEAIRFPGQKSLPSRAQLTGFGFEPSPLRACLDELQRRGVQYGRLRSLIVKTGDVWKGRNAIEEGHAAVHKTVFRNSIQRERLEELTFVGPDGQ